MVEKPDLNVQIDQDRFAEMIWMEDDGEWSVFTTVPGTALNYVDSFQDEAEARVCLAEEVRKIIVGETD